MQTLPEYSDSLLIVGHPFYLWLLEQEEEGSRANVGIGNYLAANDINTALITTDQRQSLRHILDAYHFWWMPTRKEVPLTSLLSASRTHESNPNRFWLRDGERWLGVDNLRITPRLRTLLSKVDLEYDLTPDIFYFEVINDHLFIKYQQINGSRRVCKLDL